jgi:hypothetical protein
VPIRLRHWKQRFNPNAVFVFAKRVRIGEAGDPWAPAGTVVDSARFAKRLKLWWDVGLIEIQDWTLEKAKAEAQAKQDAKKRKGKTKEAEVPPEEPPPAPSPEVSPSGVSEEVPGSAAADPGVVPPEPDEEEEVEEQPSASPPPSGEEPDEVMEALLEPLPGGMYLLPNGEKVRGKAAAIAELRKAFERGE